MLRTGGPESPHLDDVMPDPCTERLRGGVGLHCAMAAQSQPLDLSAIAASSLTADTSSGPLVSKETEGRRSGGGFGTPPCVTTAVPGLGNNRN